MLEVIKNRCSCRKFDSSKMVEDEKIIEIINAGLLAPSGMGRQTPVIICIKDKVIRDKLMTLNRGSSSRMFHGDSDPFYGAPVILLVIANKEGLSIHDGAATIENMLLEATNQGLASCWIHRAEEEIRSQEGQNLLSFTNLDFNQYVGVGHVIIGYPKDDNLTPTKVIKDKRVFIK